MRQWTDALGLQKPRRKPNAVGLQTLWRPPRRFLPILCFHQHIRLYLHFRIAGLNAVRSERRASLASTSPETAVILTTGMYHIRCSREAEGVWDGYSQFAIGPMLSGQQRSYIRQVDISIFANRLAQNSDAAQILPAGWQKPWQ